MKWKEIVSLILLTLLIMSKPLEIFGYSGSNYTAFTIEGRIVDENGKPLNGVTVIVKGTTKGTTTDPEGRFVISEVAVGDILKISYMGYEPQEVTLDGSQLLTVTLREITTALEELVVVGYAVQKKENLTGAVATIRSEELQNRPVSNVSEALQGLSSNLNITQTGSSGEAGGGLNINIRGAGSLSGNDAPYILVDGVPMDINQINPNDIESISVLKDAAASAIYGSRAPFGVILITTKNGHIGDDRVTVQYSNNFSLSSPIGLPHMTNSLNFVTAYDQASVNAGLSPNFTPMNIERIKQYMAGEIQEETWKLPTGNDWAGNGIWDIAGNGNNDWLHIFFRDNVLRQKHDVSIRGGGSKSSYFISAGLWDQPDELRYGDQFYKRYNLTANLSSQVTDWLTFNLNSKFSNEDFQYFNTTEGFDRATQYHNFLRTNPFRPLYLPNGEFSQISNIQMMEDGGKEVHNDKTYTMRLSGVLEPIKNWQTTISYSFRGGILGIDNTQSTVYGTLPDETKVAVAYPLSKYGSSKLTENYQLFNVVSTYQVNTGSHNFMGLIGFEQELNQISGISVDKNNILTPSVPSISTSTGNILADDEKSHWATQGVFGRLQYNYAGKYLAEFNIRYDGSSKFAEGDRWGIFPSISVGYVVSEENFWQPIRSYINDFKLRGSWGRLGNQNVANYLYLERLGVNTNLGWIIGDERPNFVTGPNIISPTLTWETSETKNVGLDASFLNKRLSLSFDLYERMTRRMFGPAEAVPIVLGTDPPQRNNASLETKGFELSLGWQDKIAQNWSYNVAFNLADNRTFITDYNNPNRTLSTWYVGQEMGEIWGLTTAGIYQTDQEAQAGPDQRLFYPTWGAGDIRYADLDGDNTITRGSWTADNSGDYSVIGNSNPRYLFGLNLGVEWKNLRLSAFFQGVGKRDFAFDGTTNDMLFYGFNGQQWWNMTLMPEHLDYWRPAGESNLLGPNTNAYYPKPYLSEQDYKNKQIQSRYMQSAAYVRLKNLNLSYTLNQNLLSGLRVINGATILFSCENLATFTPLTKLVDPEALSTIGWGVGKIHPLRRSFSLGINLTF
ncbi:SusC/RagA family TonB-linked outer membrane protein [Parapedobacter indicus]|uniref:TonB-linked outer membrane protein, SusC/RagA family n=1 Tax=Parapedobacter indicus TaxID=1477437 RepID=A0A1I3GPN5_9SPHI|nr:TonB-dependent receptor [Parapedobacter indicus]PPL02736.1 TonB-linked SusC/RagA family outer membrane protein [Parapedobacter indicus]SFI25430.1 TonB-linked outer membrane protein, SusC/RagA family [Parapedobacter indicus]